MIRWRSPSGALVLLSALVASSAATRCAAAAEPSALSLLGQGVDLRLGAVKSSCVTGSSTLRITPEGSLHSTYGATLASLLSTTHGNLSGGFDVGLLGASAQVDYYAQVARSEQSIGYTIDFESKLGELVLSQPAFAPAGSAALAASEADRFETCGDGFTSSLELGARLLVSAVLQFSSAEELKRFEGRVRVEALLGLIHSTRSFHEQTQSFAETSHLQVLALQQGGQPALLQRLLPSLQPQTCPLSDVERCLELFRSLLDYAAHLPAQFGTRYRAEDLSVLARRDTRYADSDLEGLAAAERTLDPRAAQSLRRLQQARADVLSQSARVELLLSLASEPRRTRLLDMRRALAVYQTALDAALQSCRAAATPPACRSAEADAAARRAALGPEDSNY